VISGVIDTADHKKIDFIVEYLREFEATLLEKMAHFLSVITYGAGRNSQWAKSFVIFSSSGEGKPEAILIHL
jgi:hypothetical protein